MWVRWMQVAGTVAADTLKLGNITIPNQGFGLVLSSSSDFVDISCDGLFVSHPRVTPALQGGQKAAQASPFRACHCLS